MVTCASQAEIYFVKSDTCRKTIKEKKNLVCDKDPAVQKRASVGYS